MGDVVANGLQPIEVLGLVIIIIIIIIKIGKIFITKPQLKSYLQSTCCYKKSNQFIKTLSTIPSLENKNNPIYNK